MVIPETGAGYSRVTHPFATDPPSKLGFTVRLACVKHAASVRPEPESNSPSMSTGPPPPKRQGNRHNKEPRNRGFNSASNNEDQTHGGRPIPAPTPRPTTNQPHPRKSRTSQQQTISASTTWHTVEFSKNRRAPRPGSPPDPKATVQTYRSQSRPSSAAFGAQLRIGAVSIPA